MPELPEGEGDFRVVCLRPTCKAVDYNPMVRTLGADMEVSFKNDPWFILDADDAIIIVAIDNPSLIPELSITKNGGNIELSFQHETGHQAALMRESTALSNARTGRRLDLRRCRAPKIG